MRTRYIVGLVILLVMAMALSFSPAAAQEKKADQDSLESKELAEEGTALDKQIADLSKKISEVIATYELANKANRFKTLPYQMSLIRGDGFIEIERHRFTRSNVDNTRITGIQKKKLKIGTDGKSANKLEFIVWERNYDTEAETQVLVTDASPATPDKKGMKFDYSVNKRLLKSMTLDQIQNTTAFPIRNELKRDFVIPHLTYFYNSLLMIGETYRKGMKDSESLMADFLKESTKY
ncbi:MAG TPA: hypothetical protein PKJ16_06505 [Spirochaetota bacterium]|nr:hypothetical protein [Spirochaetota bacterium]HOS40118.1 hypothetical protein [Spirochaetota bacterium]HPU89135.1 hypothetical protein [Spirochaetota bacterium]